MSVAPHLTRINRFGFVNVYLVGEDDGLTLVDTALPRSSKAILQAAGDLGAPIRRILLTHAHGDHVGSLDELASTLTSGGTPWRVAPKMNSGNVTVWPALNDVMT